MLLQCQRGETNPHVVESCSIPSLDFNTIKSCTSSTSLHNRKVFNISRFLPMSVQLPKASQGSQLERRMRIYLHLCQVLLKQLCLGVTFPKAHVPLYFPRDSPCKKYSSACTIPASSSPWMHYHPRQYHGTNLKIHLNYF